MKIQHMDHNDVLSLLPKRKPNSHKGDYGKVLLLCGAQGYTGAAAMSAMAALRTGTGLVYLGVPLCIYEIEAVKLLEPIVFPLCDESGCLSANAITEVDRCMRNKNAILIGPGLGQTDGVRSVVKYVLENFNGPVVLDADGINVIAAHKYLISQRTNPTIITPHKMEFERLGFPAGDTRKERVENAKRLADELGAIILLKGHETVITDGCSCYVNLTGNPGMAVGGSGDVLSGIIVSLLGQGLTPFHAAACGAWLHGRAGDICADEIGQYGMLPSDIIQVLPRLLR